MKAADPLRHGPAPPSGGHGAGSLHAPSLLPSLLRNLRRRRRGSERRLLSPLSPPTAVAPGSGEEDPKSGEEGPGSGEAPAAERGRSGGAGRGGGGRWAWRRAPERRRGGNGQPPWRRSEWTPVGPTRMRGGAGEPVQQPAAAPTRSESATVKRPSRHPRARVGRLLPPRVAWRPSERSQLSPSRPHSIYSIQYS